MGNPSFKIPDLLVDMADKINGISKDFFTAIYKK